MWGCIILLSAETAVPPAALIRAAERGDAAMCRGLISQGVDVHAQASDGGTALHAAAVKGDTEVVRALLDGGVPIGQTDNDGLTPLHRAVKKNQAPVVIALLEAAMNVSRAEAPPESVQSPAQRVVELLTQQNGQLMRGALEAVGKFDVPPAATGEISAAVAVNADGESEAAVLPHAGEGNEVPRLWAGGGMTLARLETTLRSDADGVVLLEGLFKPPEFATWEWAQSMLCADCFRLSSQFFADQRAPWKDAAHAISVARSCGATKTAPGTWTSRRFEYGQVIAPDCA